MENTATHPNRGLGGDDSLLSALEAGSTLPAGWYTDPRFLALERQAIFGQSWQYAGLLEDLQEPGDFLTCRAGNVPIVVVCGESHELRAFINVCRHRGSELVLEERGRKKSIQCHYHAWTYGLDGSLRAAPGEKLEADFDRSQFSLLSAQVETWGPFVFVNPDPGAACLTTILGELPSLIADTGLQLMNLRRRARATYEIAANWKVVVDNYLECYHCPLAHPGFSALIDVDSYRVEEYPYFSVQTAPARQKRRHRAAPYRSQGVVEEGLYAYLWPNFTINVYPGPGNVSLNLFLPIDMNHTRAIFEYCFVDEVSEAEVKEFTLFVDQVQSEDSALCESVQRGLESGFLDQGTLMLSRESALRHFQLLVYRALTGDSGS